MKYNSITYREEVRPGDELLVENIVKSTGFFSPEEIKIARELVEERIQKGAVSGYFFIFAEEDNKIIGYTCFGPIPATKFSYDLYWIAVHSDWQGKGVGKLLIKESEKTIETMGGDRIYIETSGRDLYRGTRAFYLSCDYREDACLEDFYSPNDAKHIYVKSLVDY